MSSESETEQHLMDSGSDEEQNDGSESVEVESEIESDNEEEEQEGHAEFDSEDDNNEVDSDDDVPVKETSNSSKKVKENSNPKSDGKSRMLQKYEQFKENTLYVVFPYDLPDQETLEKTAKELCSGITKVTRRKVAKCRNCYISFDSPESLNEAIIELRKVKIDGRKLFVSKAKRYNGENVPVRPCISTIIVRNIPPESTISAINELFPNSLEIIISSLKYEDTAFATVVLPTPEDAAIAREKEFKIGENDLFIYFKKDFRPNTILKPNLKHKPYQRNGKTADGSPNSKIGKRKLEEPLSNEPSSPKKNKLDANKRSGKGNQIESNEKEKNLENIKKNESKEKLKDLENIKTKTFKKETNDIKGASKAGNKHSKPDPKELKQKNNLKKK